MSNAKTASAATKLQRHQVAQAVIQGYLDSAVAADLTTAKNNGYSPDMTADTEVDTAPIGGINR